MSRVQLALRVADLDGSIAFYSKLFGTEPAKLRPGYGTPATAPRPPLANRNKNPNNSVDERSSRQVGTWHVTW